MRAMFLTRGCAAQPVHGWSGARRACIVVMCAFGGYALLVVLGAAASADTGTSVAEVGSQESGVSTASAGDADATDTPELADFAVAVTMPRVAVSETATRDAVTAAAERASALTSAILTEVNQDDEDVARRAQELIESVTGTPTPPVAIPEDPAPTDDAARLVPVEPPVRDAPITRHVSPTPDTTPATPGTPADVGNRSPGVGATAAPTQDRLLTVPLGLVSLPRPTPAMSATSTDDGFDMPGPTGTVRNVDQGQPSQAPADPLDSHRGAPPLSPAPTGQVTTQQLPAIADLSSSVCSEPPVWMVAALASRAADVRDGVLAEPPSSPD